MSGKSKTDAEWYAMIDVQIAELNAAGKSDQDIARELGISQGQASYRRANLGLVSPYTAGIRVATEKTEAGKAKEADILRQRQENAIPAGRGGDALFGRLMGDREFEDHPRLRPGQGPLPPPLPLPSMSMLMSMSGSAAAWCASVGVSSRFSL